MFLCRDCHPKGCTWCTFSSAGRCEGCGKTRACADCHSSLPVNEPKKEGKKNKNGRPVEFTMLVGIARQIVSMLVERGASFRYQYGTWGMGSVWVDEQDVDFMIRNGASRVA